MRDIKDIKIKFKAIGIDIEGKTFDEALEELSIKWNELKYPWYTRLWWFIKDLFRGMNI